MPNRPKSPASSDNQRTSAVEPTEIRVLPRDLGSLFSHRPLILGESEADYDLLLSKVTESVAPTDPVEAMWVKDFTDLTWESERLKRLKASLLMSARKVAIDRLASETNGPLVRGPESLSSGYTNAWLKGEKAAVEHFDALLAKRGLDVHSVMALALSERLNDIERIDRMITSADARRYRLLFEIERRREAKARQQRTVAEDVTAVSWRKAR